MNFLALANYLLLLLLHDEAIAASRSFCPVIFDDRQVIERPSFVEKLPKEKREELDYAEQFFKEQGVEIAYERVSYILSNDGLAVRILPTGNHALNRLAKDILEHHGANVVYVVGNRDPTFAPDIVRGEITGLNVMLPIDLLALPANLVRTFPVLHELRHLMDYLSAFKGEDTAFLGHVMIQKRNTEIPGNIAATNWGYEKAFGFNEIRTHYSQLYQQGLRFSLRLKQGDMSNIEMRERFESIADTLDILNILVDRTKHSLTAVQQLSAKGLLSRLFGGGKELPHTIEQLRYGNHSISIVEITLDVGQVPLIIKVPLPQLKANEKPYDAAIAHLQWTLSASQAVEAHLLAPNQAFGRVDSKNLSTQDLRSFVDAILANVQPGQLAPFYRQ
jgi:hypothetical protein